MKANLQALFQRDFAEYARTRRLPLRAHQAAESIIQCRTAGLGGHVKRCSEGHVAGVWYNSCHHRACPQCSHLQVRRWLEAQKAKLLACDHYHVVFTVPQELIPLWQWNRRRMTGHLFRCARDSLFELLGDRRYLGALPGMLAALHSWGRTLSRHPHLHCLVTGGGWSGDKGWSAISNGYLLPARVVKALFRGKLLAGLRQDLARGQLMLPPDSSSQQAENLFRKLQRKSWNVRIQERYPHEAGVLTYLARYIRGGPISNHRLVQLGEQHVVFRYTDHRDGRAKCMRLRVEEFFARLLWHVPETGTHHVRHYGLYASAHKAARETCRHELGQPCFQERQPLTWQEYCDRLGCRVSRRCPICDSPIVRLEPFRRGREPPLIRPAQSLVI